MSAIAQNCEIFQGDNTPLRIIVKNEYEQVKDITGASITWRLKRYQDSAASVLIKTTDDDINIVDGLNGEFSISFSTEETSSLTGKYYHECRIVDGLGQARVVCYGNMTVRNWG